MSEQIHNMPGIPIDTVLQVMDRNYLFSSVVKSIADTFDSPKDKLARMRIVRDVLLASITELSVISDEVIQELSVKEEIL